MVTYIEKGKRQYKVLRNHHTGMVKLINPDHRIGQMRIKALAAKGWTDEGRLMTSLSIPQIMRGVRA